MVCRVLAVISLLLSLVSCEKEQDKVEDGVSLELAKERKANIGGVTYKLFFSCGKCLIHNFRKNSPFTFLCKTPS